MSENDFPPQGRVTPMDARVEPRSDGNGAVFVPLRDASDVPWEGGRRLADWWFSVPDGRSGPSLRDFDPRRMGRFLSGLIVVDVVDGGRSFRIRLAGEDHRLGPDWRLKGADPTRMPLPCPSDARIRWLVRERRPYLALDLPPPRTVTDVRGYSVVAFPLFDDGERVTTIIAHTKYETRR